MKKYWLAATLALTLFAGQRFAPAQRDALANASGKPQAKSQDKPQLLGVSGKWQFMLDTPGGERDADADFTVDADGKVTGTWGKTSTAGTFKDGQLNLSFEYTSEESSDSGTMKIIGKLDDSGAISGTWQFSSYDGSFKAFRPKS